MRSVGGHVLARMLGDWSGRSPTGPAYATLAAALRSLILDGRVPLEDAPQRDWPSEAARHQHVIDHLEPHVRRLQTAQDDQTA
jgi:hypothetical protein